MTFLVYWSIAMGLLVGAGAVALVLAGLFIVLDGVSQRFGIAWAVALALLAMSAGLAALVQMLGGAV